MSPISLLALALSAADPTPVVAAPAPVPVAAGAAVELPPIDEGAVVEAVEAVLARGHDIVRIAVPPVADSNAGRARAVELAVVSAILDRRREEPVTPAYLRAHLAAQGEAQARDVGVEQLKPFACDHVLITSVVDQGGKALLRLKLLKSETGEVLGEESAELGEGKATSASAAQVRIATDRVVGQIAAAIESSGDDVRLHRIAVSPLRAEGAAKEARLDVFAQSELIRGLKRRGFLVVERAQLAAALNQLALGQVLDEQGAPQVGKALGAQSLVVGSVNDAGATFALSVRVVSAESGKVLGAAAATLPRDNVVSMAAVETRTPLEAALRSVVAPGWGQSYNGQGVKALAFALGGYGGLVTTGALAASGAVVQAHYGDVGYFEKLPAAQAGQEAVAARNTFTTLYTATAIAGGVTAVVWGLGIVDALISSPSN